eukprot:2462803-Rhodomonas_salina.1
MGGGVQRGSRRPREGIRYLSTAHRLARTRTVCQCRTSHSRRVGTAQYILCHYRTWRSTYPYARCSTIRCASTGDGIAHTRTLGVAGYARSVPGRA